MTLNNISRHALRHFYICFMNWIGVSWRFFFLIFVVKPVQNHAREVIVSLKFSDNSCNRTSLIRRQLVRYSSSSVHHAVACGQRWSWREGDDGHPRRKPCFGMSRQTWCLEMRLNYQFLLSSDEFYFKLRWVFPGIPLPRPSDRGGRGLPSYYPPPFFPDTLNPWPTVPAEPIPSSPALPIIFCLSPLLCACVVLALPLVKRPLIGKSVFLIYANHMLL